MRQIQKRSEDWHLAKRHQHPPATSTEASSAWHSFNYKDKTQDICLTEQFGLCAFSETVLEDSDLGMHLDHVEPKSKNPSRTFDHGNLVLSAIADTKLSGLAKHEIFGGHYRRSRYSRAGFIHPLKPDSRRFFHYASTGEVGPALGLSESDARKARGGWTVSSSCPNILWYHQG